MHSYDNAVGECNLVYLIHSIYVPFVQIHDLFIPLIKINQIAPVFVLVLEFDHTIRKANGISQWTSVAGYKNQKFELSG